ncbi:4-hydroxy-tetrahydrodipicolinate synthase [Thiospirochaeta perfilievii]|uniref:4-hydroxy-tetrahydrodipicolinate synthase n=1 Tax=Thiospirochaeta perfilievii TaxID=252967 RepID=A0A5C1QCA7_9SPIO|nr:4-hydroxy-tetrahydrodipicolinate synthase [Thiospirochaeta perfilievii]QEN05723.1 4-hydroxy-tetrahydrodipicolinate synthase [Thiospirochaeta perfilievii]
MFSGVYTALITPFKEDGSIDFDSYRALINNQIKEGITGLLPVGTTGESPTLSHEENLKVVEEAIKIADGKTPVVAGTGSNSTKEAVDMTLIAKSMGADASLQVAPYYNKPTQEGLYRHFMTIADKCDIPLLIYNIKGRSGVNIETDTLLRMAKHENIVGVKEASGDLAQMMDVIRNKPEGFSVMVGDDNIAFPFVALGGDGVVSVISNIIPRKMEKLVSLTKSGDIEEARKIHYEILPLCKGMFLETSPIPVKSALALMGICKEVYRLPLCEPMDSTREKLKTLLKESNLI